MSAAATELRGLIGDLRKSGGHLATIRKIGQRFDAAITELEERVARIQYLDRLRSTTWPGGDGVLRP
ncbi:MAG TPA: hypothetical protein VMF05_05995 [Stellaceae bacterium]|nr:hypothetical protein [Stellaceae bacterium]